MEFGVLRPSNRISLSLGDQVRVYIEDEGAASKTPAGRDMEAGKREPELDDDGWTLSLEDSRLPHSFSRGWLLGCSSDKASSGPMKVDFLLAGPRKIQSTIAPIHLIFKISPDSGILLYKSVSPDHKVEVLDDGKFVEIRCNQYRAVILPLTKFRLGGKAEYDLICYVPNLVEHIGQLNEVFHNSTGKFIERLIRFRPSSTTRVFKSTGVCVNNESLAGGVEGLVSEAFSLEGTPLAVKSFHSNSRSHYKSVINEYKIASLFRDSRTVAGALRLWCEHDEEAESCARCEEKNGCYVKWYMSFRLAYGNFVDVFSNKPTNYEDITECLYQCLGGIADIHSRGYIHRDISLRNLLVFSTDPWRASVADFGKAVKHERGDVHFEMALGPVHYVAPEVWSGQGYGPSVDLYCLAICAALLVTRLPWRGKVTSDGLRELRSLLHARGKEKPNAARLMELLCSVLQFDVDSRPSLEQALMHECWVNVRAGQEDFSHKRPRFMHEQIQLARYQPVEAGVASQLTAKRGSLGTVTPTQPFSDRFYSSALAQSTEKVEEANDDPPLAPYVTHFSD